MREFRIKVIDWFRGAVKDGGNVIPSYETTFTTYHILTYPHEACGWTSAALYPSLNNMYTFFPFFVLGPFFSRKEGGGGERVYKE